MQAGFRYHHAEPDYLMLVYWIPQSADTLPANASHRVGIGAFVVNNKKEVFLCVSSFIWANILPCLEYNQTTFCSSVGCDINFAFNEN